MTGMGGYEQEVALIYDFVGLDSELATALLLRPAEIDIEEERRLHAAGLGMAEAEDDEGNVCLMTYVRQENHIVVRALQALAEAEDLNVVPIGTHNEAIDCIRSGEKFGVLDLFVAMQV